jgi:hypothetical protein
MRRLLCQRRPGMIRYAACRRNCRHAPSRGPGMALSHSTSSQGVARFVFAHRRTTRLARLFQKAPLRVLMPRPAPGEPPCAVLLNTSGGIVGGDALQVEVRLEAGAAAVITSQAAEKAARRRSRCRGWHLARVAAAGDHPVRGRAAAAPPAGRCRGSGAPRGRGHAGLRAARAGRAVPERLPL